jgi:hypothetical protein
MRRLLWPIFRHPYMGTVPALIARNAGHGALPRARRWSPCVLATAVIAAIALIAGAARPALAQESPMAPPILATGQPAPDPAPPVASADVVEAREAFLDGIARANEDRWAEALDAFERSAALRPHAITTYNIGYCERHLGRVTLARKMLLKALADDRARGGELPDSLVRATQTYLAEAEAQIARVVVTLAPGALTVDGRPLERTDTPGPRPVLVAGTRPVGAPESPPGLTFDVELDPGTHVFVLSSNGRPAVVASETSAPGSTSTLDLRPPIETPSMMPPPERPHEDGSPFPDRPNRVPGFVVLGLGGAALATGAIGGLVAFGYKGVVHAACASPDTADACSGKRDAGNRAADVATAGFIVGGVGIGLGALLLVAPGHRSARRAATTRRTVEVHPVIGWRTLGLDGWF